MCCFENVFKLYNVLLCYDFLLDGDGTYVGLMIWLLNRLSFNWLLVRFGFDFDFTEDNAQQLLI